MNVQQTFRRSVSFNLKPDVQLFTNRTPHTSPILTSSNSQTDYDLQMQMAQLNLDATIQNAVQSLNSISANFESDSIVPLSLSRHCQDITEQEYNDITVSPRTAALGPMPLSPRSVNQIFDMRQQEQTQRQQAIHEANELNTSTTVFIDRNQGRPILVRFSTLYEAWHFGIAYLYNHTEGAAHLFPITDSIKVKKIAQTWVNKESPPFEHSPPNSMSSYQIAYKLGGTSLFSITLYKGHEMPAKQPHTFRQGIIITGPINAMKNGPYMQMVLPAVDTTNYFNDTTEMLVFTIPDRPLQEIGWHSAVETVIKELLTKIDVF